ncbi:putative inactive dehydrogenase EasA [Hypsizygus marmoreus]|uniref:Inactive dehydrogenase EasA n=1 Tax=Hypsizygus marmoreus TaxID=39966 RepID=A0A369JFP5_HYPMA|nr:putative inactive dehydrogenase EasA [Hypsizygus marmoreus]
MSPSTITPKLFQPIQVGNITLSHRLVLAPLTRYKATKTAHVPVVSLVKEYYSQRSSTPGTLLVTEATFIAAKAGGYANVPGIWSPEQITAWKEVTDQVHANGSFIFLQLWALGRAAYPDVLASEDLSLSFVAPSSIPLSSHPTAVPRELTTTEIHEYVQLYAQAAKNAVLEAGFDGVEVHGANGYLVDQFLQDVSNRRSDEYGGSVEARSRFGLEVIDAIVDAVGPERTAIRLSPWSLFQDMGMQDPVPQFTHFVSTLKAKHPTLAYIHVVEPRINGNADRTTIGAHESNDFIRTIWSPLPFITAGGYTRDTAIEAVEKNGGLVAFGRWFLSNPDLPLRLKKNIPLSPYDRKTFYVPVDKENPEVGYIDYPFAEATA